jgi:putative transposase
VLAEEHGYRSVLHDRDSIYSPWLDAAVTAMGVRVLRTPAQAPMANAVCERLLGSLRRECLDFLIPLKEHHLLRIPRKWRTHYNRGRPHTSLGPGIPHPPAGLPATPLIGHRLPSDARVVARSILGGMHHEYSLEKEAA